MTTSNLPGLNQETLWRGDTYQWIDLLEENVADPPDPPDWQPKDISGYTMRAQLKADPDDETPMAVFTLSFVTDGTDGKILRYLPASESRKLVPGAVYFDLELTRTSDGFVKTFLAGTWIVEADVSRATA